MRRSRRSPAYALTLLMLSLAALGSCSSDPKPAADDPTPTVFTAKNVSCDRDRTSLDAKDTIERVGGLVTDDYVVRFSQSTRLGVVALVDGDIQKASDELTGDHGVALVAETKDDDTGQVTGFQQIRDLVASVCD